MTEYLRQFDRIHAGFALHAGKVLVQYRSHAATLAAEDQYEGTLAVCVLHSLLTNCSELRKYMKKKQIHEPFFDQVINDGAKAGGLKTAFILQNTFPGEDLTLGSLLEHVRNAVSHPSLDKVDGLPTADNAVELKPTGYTTVNRPPKPIAAYRFIDSPWLKDGNRHYMVPLPVETPKEARSLIRKFHRENNVEEECLEVLPLSKSEFDIAQKGRRRQYWPIFEIQIPLVTVFDLAVCLADHLAQHRNKAWDKKSIEGLMASLRLGSPPLQAALQASAHVSPTGHLAVGQ